MNLNGVMVGTEDPGPLVAYYTKLFGEPMDSDGDYTWWQFGSGVLTIGKHSEVKGSNEDPGRVIWNLETEDVPGEFERLKGAGALVVREPYQPGPDVSEMWIATLADPDGNYFQLVSPMG